MLGVKLEKPPETGIPAYYGLRRRVLGVSLRTVWNKRKATKPRYTGYTLILGLWWMQLVFRFDSDKA